MLHNNSIQYYYSTCNMNKKHTQEITTSFFLGLDIQILFKIIFLFIHIIFF